MSVLRRSSHGGLCSVPWCRGASADVGHGDVRGKCRRLALHHDRKQCCEHRAIRRTRARKWFRITGILGDRRGSGVRNRGRGYSRRNVGRCGSDGGRWSTDRVRCNGADTAESAAHRCWRSGYVHGSRASAAGLEGARASRARARFACGEPYRDSHMGVSVAFSGRLTADQRFPLA